MSVALLSRERADILPPVAEARRIIQAATSVPEVKVLRDQAALAQDAWKHEAAQELMGRREAFKLMQGAAEVKLVAERKLGAMLSEVTPRGRWLRDEITGQVRGATRSLPKGISPIQSLRWRRVAAVPEPVFEKWLADTIAADEEITQAALLRLAQPFINKGEDGLDLNGDDCDEADDQDDDDTDDADDDQDDTSSQTQRVSLFPTKAGHERLLARCETLKGIYGTSDLTSTIEECVRRAVEGLE